MADADGAAGPRGPRVMVPVEAIAGLASGGLLVIGCGLVVLQFLAPALAPGSGLTVATGPGWARTLMQLGVGVVGELARWRRSRVGGAVRVVWSCAVIVAAVAVLYVAWWA